MAQQNAGIEEVSGYLGVGSLVVLGALFVVDGAANLVPFLETVFRTTTWTLLAAVPMLVISYVLGLVSSLGAELMLRPLLPTVLTPDHFRAVSQSGNEMLIHKYGEVERHTRLLFGCSVAFVILGLGCWSETRLLGDFAWIGYLCLAVALALAVLCPLLAQHLQRRLVKFVAGACGRDHSSGT